MCDIVENNSVPVRNMGSQQAVEKEVSHEIRHFHYFIILPKLMCLNPEVQGEDSSCLGFRSTGSGLRPKPNTSW